MGHTAAPTVNSLDHAGSTLSRPVAAHEKRSSAICGTPRWKQAVTVDDAGKRFEVGFKTTFPTWPNMNVTGFVRSIYAE